VEKSAFNRKLDFNLRKKPIKCCVWITALAGAEKYQKNIGSLVLEKGDQLDQPGGI
jgi:hypothetical protein